MPSLKEKTATELMVIHGGIERTGPPRRASWFRTTLLWAAIAVGIAMAQCGAG
jgi:hypothetical protein